MKKGTVDTTWLETEQRKLSANDLSTCTREAGASPPVSGSARPKRRWIAPTALLGAVVIAGASLTAWKAEAIEEAKAASAHQVEPAEAVTVAIAQNREHRRTTTSIGTVVALRSISLRNEVAGTVAKTSLVPGEIVEAGAVLVAMDVSVEQAELKALEAQAALARTLAERMERAVKGRATSQIELDRALSELEVAQAQIARTQAVINRKTIRAPFRARIGLSDVHPGQYLNEGTLIASLQGISDATQVDFSVPQQVAQNLEVGDMVEIIGRAGDLPVEARIVALDARVDMTTRNRSVRARVDDARSLPPPGASVRVEVPAGEVFSAVSIPINAARKSPNGDHVFIIKDDAEGNFRAHMRKVHAGPALGDEVLILSGLQAGERVAVIGSFKLREQALVAIVDTPTVSASK